MGTKKSKVSANRQINKGDFITEHPIGRGGFGKVWKVKHKKSKRNLAMKEMSKVKIYDKMSVASVVNERKLLSHLQHPFLVNMFCAFQDSDYLYLAMDFLEGGDLRFHMIRRKFSEPEARL